jgi:hypothetical protein
MSYISGENRGQAALLPAAIEDYVAADAPVRVIDAFVNGLDARGLGFGRAVSAVMGLPPYDPRDLVKLYLYGYLNEVRSVVAQLEVPGSGKRQAHYWPARDRAGGCPSTEASGRLHDYCRIFFMSELQMELCSMARRYSRNPRWKRWTWLTLQVQRPTKLNIPKNTTKLRTI